MRPHPSPLTARLLALVIAASTLHGSAAAQTTVASSRYTLLRDSAPVPAALRKSVDVDADSVPMIDVVRRIASAAGVGLTYDRTLPGLLDQCTTHLHRIAAATAIVRTLGGSSIDAMVSSSGSIVLVRRAVKRGSIQGMVMDSAGAPIAGVRVMMDDRPVVAASGANGAFRLDGINPGRYTLHTQRIGYRPASQAIELGRVDSTVDPVIISLEPVATPLAGMVVSPAHYGIMGEATVVSQVLDREQIRTRPQLGDDLFRSINRLPGVTSGDMSAGFHIRGNEVDATYVSLDGLQLFEPFHLKDIEGALSILDVHSASGIDLTSGGFTSEYGGRLGGVLEIRSLEPSATDRSTTLGASITNVRAQSQGTFGDGRGGWIVSARRGFLDLALRLTYAGDSVSPVYGDMFGKVSWTFGDKNRVEAHTLLASDRLRYSETGGAIESRYLSTYGWLTWDTRPSSRVEGRTILALSGLTWDRIGTPIVTHGQPLVTAGPPDDVHDRRRFADASLREDWTFSAATWAVWRWGGEWHQSRATYDYRGLHSSADFVNDTLRYTSRTIEANLAPSGSQSGAYASFRVMPTARLTTELGARYDHAEYSGDETFSPRANVALTVTPWTTLRAAAGRYAQPVTIYGLQVQDGVSQFKPADVANQYDVGLEQRIGGLTTLRVDAYRSDLVRERGRYENLQTNTFIFPEFAPDRVFVDATSGRSSGIEFMLQQRAPGGEGLDWSASYALAHVTDDVDGVAVPRKFDQRHTAYVDASYRPRGASWRLTTAWQFHSGWPMAPVAFRLDSGHVGKNSAVIVHQGFAGISEFGRDRLPWYHRLDVRFTRDVETRRGLLSFFVDVYNVLNSMNTRSEGYNYSLNNGRFVYVPNPNAQIPRLPSAGIEWAF